MPATAMSAIALSQPKYPASLQQEDDLVLVAMRAADVAGFLAQVERYLPERAVVFDLLRESPPPESCSRDISAPRRERPGLTGRQREIMVLLAGGLSNKQIARQLAISHFTVRNHVSHILRAFNLTTRRQAMHWFSTMVGPGLDETRLVSGRAQAR